MTDDIANNLVMLNAKTVFDDYDHSHKILIVIANFSENVKHCAKPY
jgi:hypothetical protein